MDNSILLGIPLGIVIAVIVVIAVVAFAGWSRNKSRYDIPKYLPRDDERAWAICMVSAKRVWALGKCQYISYDDWDLGILKVDSRITEEYETKPRFGDCILAPKKWGGYHALVVTRELSNQRFITVYLGEFDAKQFIIYDGRDRTRSKTIS